MAGVSLPGAQLGRSVHVTVRVVALQPLDVATRV